MNEQILRFHPASDIFPLMEGEDLEELAQDIREHGLRERITLHPDGSILDGRNRYRACLRVGIEPKFVTWEDDGSPVSFVISLNLKRRQLTSSQRAMIGRKAMPMLEAEARERQRTAGKPLRNGERKGMARDLAGAAVDVSGESIRRAEVVVKHGVPELAEKVKVGEMTVRRASLIATLPPEEQRTLMAGTEEEIASRTKELRRAEKKEEGAPQPHKNEQAPAGTRRLPKHVAAADFRRSVQTLQGICLGLAKLNTAEILKAFDAPSLRKSLGEVITILRGVYRALGGNSER